MIPGIEIAAPPARRSTWSARPIPIPLTPAEAMFLLYRLADLTAVAEAIAHHPAPGKMVSPWSREQIIRRAIAIVKVLRRGQPLWVLTPLDTALIVQGIEGNPYFARMADDDPRLTPTAARAANALREKVQKALGRPVGRVPLGGERRRVAEPPGA